jgi:hypothetical protein
MKMTALKLASYGARLMDTQGHIGISLESGAVLPLPVDPVPMSDSAKEDNYDASDSQAAFAIITTCLLDQAVFLTNKDPKLTPFGKTQALAAQRTGSVKAVATAWAGLLKQAAVVADRGKILYGAPELAANDSAGALVDIEIREWLRAQPVESISKFLNGLLDGGRDAKAERVMEAILRSPIPIGAGVIETVVNEVWHEIVGIRKPGIVASVALAEKNLDFSQRAVITCAQFVRARSQMDERQLYAAVRTIAGGGAAVFGFDAQKAAMLDRQLDAAA